MKVTLSLSYYTSINVLLHLSADKRNDNDNDNGNFHF